VSSTHEAGREVAEDRLAFERELAARTYGDVFSQYEQARLKMAAAPTLIQIIRSASPPSASGRFPAVAGLAAGGMAGLLLSLVLGIGWSYVTSSRPTATVR